MHLNAWLANLRHPGIPRVVYPKRPKFQAVGFLAALGIGLGDQDCLATILVERDVNPASKILADVHVMLPDVVAQSNPGRLHGSRDFVREPLGT